MIVDRFGNFWYNLEENDFVFGDIIGFGIKTSTVTIVKNGFVDSKNKIYVLEESYV